ncbi:MAG: aminomethyl-transferring glycine dehydrogenase subunit GcvPA [Synergistaceae bacterium]|jgi:glycine dehydrogenase subunit 1|nr:aminomethyl-transferring glycine dehydrogenase subunit GcvPA [Synergistaceae bacterium]
MAYYAPSTEDEQLEMMREVGVSSWDGLYADLPEELLLDGLAIPDGASEFGAQAVMERLASKNAAFQTIFRGAGAYNHYIPSLVKQITSKEEFVTSYTPYQAEISQGTLQSIFEFQTMMCELTGLDASNASVYDGAAAAAEAAAMCRSRDRRAVLVSEAAKPNVISVVETYCYAAGAELRRVPTRGGLTDGDALAAMLDGSSACVYIEQPNFFGLIEDASALGRIAHGGGAKFVMGVNPIAAALLKTPGECGADVAVGEGQPLGMPLSFGGPYLGFMTAAEDMARKLPGRIVGETVDADGKRAFVLTLQAREQHIRREKASSNICSNQALCALSAAVYMTVMGPRGLRQAAESCFSKAHYAERKISSVRGFEPVYEGEFFHEFVTACPVGTESLMRRLESRGILGGMPVDDGILWCVTEMNSRAEIDDLVSILKEVAEG